jgi:hypothetical protein
MIEDHNEFISRLKHETQDTSLPPIVQCAGEIYEGLTRLINRDEISAPYRAKCFICLGYFLIGDDVFPEDVHGPIGYIEDCLIAFDTILQISQDLGSEGDDLIISCFNFKTFTFQHLLEDFHLNVSKYEHLYFKALNHTGLISDEEYSLITQQEEG